MELSETGCPACGADVMDIDVKCGECGASLASTGAQRLVGTTVLEQYQIVDVIGQGGMSVVYRAKHVITDQLVALKILPRELARHTQVRSRFLEEARALAQLDHPNIVHLYNFGEDQGCFVLAMQHVEGQTWERLILSSQEAGWEVSTRIAIDVLSALEYAHARGIVHRDMKPSNVLIRNSDGSATVMDFGIAKMTTSSRLTATGQTMGTVRYMSPEQVRGMEVDLRTDLYSLACTLYEALLGETPFDGDTHFEIMTKHLSEPPPSLRAQGVACPAALDALVLRGLSKRREDRPPSAREYKQMLEAVLRQSAGDDLDPSTVVTPIESPAVPPRSSRALPPPAEPVAAGRTRAPLWIGLALAVVAAGIAAFVLTRRDAENAAAAAPSRPARAPVDQPAWWPAAFLLDNLSVAADRRFETDAVRVITERERPAEPIRDSVVAGQTEFAALLRQRKLAAEVTPHPLNVVVVTSRHVFCDRRLYRGGDPADCGQLEHYYRPLDRTVYILDNAALVRDLKWLQAVNICLHELEMDGCDATAADYRASLEAAE